jgi:hypothetical protein
MIRIIDNWCEKIHCLYYQFTAVQTYYGGIIGTIKSYDDIFLKSIFKITQYLG